MGKTAVVVVFARLPIPGKAKTRLAAGVGPEAAAQWYKLCAETVFAEVSRCSTAEAVVYCSASDDVSAVQQWLHHNGTPLLVQPQQQTPDLGQRMIAALSAAVTGGQGTDPQQQQQQQQLPPEADMHRSRNHHHQQQQCGNQACNQRQQHCQPLSTANAHPTAAVTDGQGLSPQQQQQQLLPPEADMHCSSCRCHQQQQQQQQECGNQASDQQQQLQAMATPNAQPTAAVTDGQGLNPQQQLLSPEADLHCSSHHHHQQQEECGNQACNQQQQQQQLQAMATPNAHPAAAVTDGQGLNPQQQQQQQQQLLPPEADLHCSSHHHQQQQQECGNQACNRQQQQQPLQAMATPNAQPTAAAARRPKTSPSQHNAHQNAQQEAQQQYQAALVIGTDIPDLSASIVDQAVAALRHHDMVLGPARDGGFYLMGFTTRALLKPEVQMGEIFEGVTWSTGSVMQRTVEAATAVGLQLAPLDTLPVLQDIDTQEDLRVWLGQRETGRQQQQQDGEQQHNAQGNHRDQLVAYSLSLVR